MKPQRASVRIELLGWIGTAVFVACSYALRRSLDRRAPSPPDSSTTR
jgi:hypothetical protein